MNVYYTKRQGTAYLVVNRYTGAVQSAWEKPTTAAMLAKSLNKQVRAPRLYRVKRG